MKLACTFGMLTLRCIVATAFMASSNGYVNFVFIADGSDLLHELAGAQ